MKSYIGTKIINAEPMCKSFFYNHYRKNEKWEGEDLQGYLVVCEDGYKSWSPKAVFEKAYREISVDEKELI